MNSAPENASTIRPAATRIDRAVSRVRRGWRGPSPADNPYWLTRFVILRCLGAIYVVAFLVLALQLLPLLGRNGLTPIVDHLAAMKPAGVSSFDAFVQRPSVLWFGASDARMLTLAWFGFAGSLLVVVGFANGLLLFLLWLLYLSFVHTGQLWYGFGWEIMLLELGFLAIFLCRPLSGRPFPVSPPPRVVIWLMRWFTFRVMFGAGMIKLRGDPCWSDFSCLLSHFETQPVPHPLSWYFHHLPEFVLRAGVAVNHFVEVVVPFFVFGPRPARRFAGACIIAFQATLIASGNLAFLNWLTIVGALACFDDGIMRLAVPRRVRDAAARARTAAKSFPAGTTAAWAYAAIVACLSLAPIENLISSRQLMNTSFDRLHLVNTYGAFGSVGRERNEIVLEGTLDAEINAETVWIEYPWKCKPGDPDRRPCLITPYHYRLDWLIWFAAMSDYRNHPWVVHLIWKLLNADSDALSLLADDPFDGRLPSFVRAELYRYEFTEPGDPSGGWWRRTRLGSYLPAVSLDNESLLGFLQQRGWARD